MQLGIVSVALPCKLDLSKCVDTFACAVPTRGPAACRYLQAAAALVQYPGAGVCRELLRLLCWVPVKRFSVGMMRVAVVAWHWVLAAAPQELQMALLAEIADAWAYTVRARMGLFAHHSTTQHADGGGEANGHGDANGSAADGDGVHLRADAAAAAAAAVDAIQAHHLWVAFLWEVRCRHANGSTVSLGTTPSCNLHVHMCVCCAADSPLLSSIRAHCALLPAARLLPPGV